jgi:hypothetical protein
MSAIILHHLTAPQRDALVDLVIRNGLDPHPDRPGCFDGTVVHRGTTMKFLQRRGVCRLLAAGAEPTAVARAAVTVAYGSVGAAYLQHRFRT